MEPIPVGSNVHYHGSVNSYHGLYEVEAHHTMDEVKQLRPDIVYRKGDEADAYLAESYTDGVSYDLWPVGVSKKFDNRRYALYGARRDSITPVARESWGDSGSPVVKKVDYKDGRGFVDPGDRGEVDPPLRGDVHL